MSLFKCNVKRQCSEPKSSSGAKSPSYDDFDKCFKSHHQAFFAARYTTQPDALKMKGNVDSLVNLSINTTFKTIMHSAIAMSRSKQNFDGTQWKQLQTQYPESIVPLSMFHSLFRVKAKNIKQLCFQLSPDSSIGDLVTDSVSEGLRHLLILEHMTSH